jgi:hypothetical protein
VRNLKESFLKLNNLEPFQTLILKSFVLACLSLRFLFVFGYYKMGNLLLIGDIWQTIRFNRNFGVNYGKHGSWMLKVSTSTQMGQIRLNKRKRAEF